MATCAIWKVTKRLDKVINYTTNIEKTKKERTLNNDDYYELHKVLEYAKANYKTEEQFFVSGINCDPKFAINEMKNTKKFFNKEGGIVAYHAFQSFNEYEVTPELAHQIGIEFANELWGDRFQVVVSTHLNTNHIHNHFVLNSVSFVDGKKFYDNRYTYSLMRHLNDEICKEYNLKTLEEKQCRKSKINIGNYYLKYEQKENYLLTAKKDIDYAIKKSLSFSEFKEVMKKLGYFVINRYGKLSIRREPYKRNIRIERQWGKEYSIENIKKRILEEFYIEPYVVTNLHIGKYSKKRIKASRNRKIKVKGFMAIYLHYYYLLHRNKNNKHKYRKSDNMKKNIYKMNNYSNEAKFLVKNKINTNEDLTKYEIDLKEKLNRLLSNREILWYKRKRINDISDYEKMTNEIHHLTEEIKEKRKDVLYCKDIKLRIKQIKEPINLQKHIENNKIKNYTREVR